MTEHIRHCCNPACREEITACFGFQLARDTVAAQTGVIPWTKVREHCGKCVEWMTLRCDITGWYLRSILPFPEPCFDEWGK